MSEPPIRRTPDGKPIEHQPPRTDKWQHHVLLEASWHEGETVAYPKCIAGANACPTEGCGGIPGYRHLLKALRDPEGPGHAERITLAGGWYDPVWFDPKLVRLGDPKVRWQCMIDGKPLPEGMRTAQYLRMRKAPRT
ncbi:MAG: plasmid pRiA4b ORF-3 family protein [Lentisphaerae bacterium]|nr:plasmid pRiA4b ORF-3 family protein [Lentisphaerota bacterium]